ncbi:prenyltransferase [soil metagenome]
MTSARLDLPAVPGILTAAEVAATAETIAAVQLASGLILWFPGGHGDPWNHVEAAVALAVAGRRAEAEAAYDWLARTQRRDGAWHHYYVADGGSGGERVEAEELDANVCAYVATGVWHHFLLTGDTGFLEALWPVVDAAVDFVLGLQTRRGEVLWARHADGTPWPYALLTGSSSICHSLACALAIAGRLGHDRRRWERGRARLVRTVVTVPDAFAPKDRWAMDWYYPVLAGVVGGDAGRLPLAEGWDRFVLPGGGTRCVHDRPWVTAAETSECALAHLAVGDEHRARLLLAWAQDLRAGDGSSFPGVVLPEGVHFPGEERSTYSAAVMILAADGLSRTTPASGLFLPSTLLAPRARAF